MITAIPIFAIVLLGFFSVGIPLAALPNHVHETLGFGNVAIGVTLGLQSLVTLLTRHYSGTVADIKGAKVAVSRGIILAIAAGLITLFSVLDSTHAEASLGILLIGRMVLGVAESLLITGALAWGVGLLGPQRAGRVMAWNGMAMYGAIAVSAPINAFALKHYGFTSVIGMTVALPLIAGIIAFFVPSVPASGKERMPFYRVVGQVWRAGVGLSLTAVGFAGLAGFATLYFNQNGWADASLVMATFGAAFILARLFFAHAPDQYGGKKIALIAVSVETIGQALVWLAPSSGVAIAGAALTGFGYSLAFPSFGVEAVKKIDPQFKGVALGAYVAFFDLALGLTGPLAGLVANSFGYSAVYVFGFISCALAAIVAWRLK